MESDTVAAEHPATGNLLSPTAAFHNESVLSDKVVEVGRWAAVDIDDLMRSGRDRLVCGCIHRWFLSRIGAVMAGGRAGV